MEHLFAKEVFTYNTHKDKYTCPQGEILRPVARTQFKSKYSKREITTYRTERGTCSACPLREKCTTNVKLGRAITRNGYEEYRERMRAKINTAEGRAIYGKRKCLVEPVFGQMKTRNGFSQFLLRGLEKVKLEWKIVATAITLAAGSGNEVVAATTDVTASTTAWGTTHVALVYYFDRPR
jgi:hypothetical protein